MRNLNLNADFYFKMNKARKHYKFVEENDLLNILRKKIIYRKTDDWYSLMLTNRRESSELCSYWKRSQLLSNRDINSYPSRRSLTIVRPDNIHFQ
ncbi:unnamed protein product [Didymodactylos carnosus]|uniref:Uncharacterized protein n=1 Tax=Didymodactylos carnosus TaxID=1234261 RepID=A0A8S2DAN6_9BILA|nr:unnamed protein product [Didymodactylos carnosus]CAF3662989.1 unnamed protein product [Didymodactylos carnosus]